ncbi:MAG: leucine-rich repeat protein, partial [Bacteroidales bacterium]|nr:leucine-rich repeat protein [Bacteroidales bacterium]
VAIILPETIQKIAENAFRGCGKLVAIVIPKSVVEIAQNAFIGCESLTEIVNNSIITEIIIQEEDPGQEDPDPNDEEIDINTDPEAPVFLPEAVLPKKIVKIEHHWTEDGYHDKGDSYYDFIYDAEGRLISYRDKYYRNIYKYTKNSITYKEEEDRDVVLTLDGNKVVKYTCNRYSRQEVINYAYSADGILQKITMEEGEALYTIQNGLITSVEDNYPEYDESSKYTFEYTDVKNNLNIDLFHLLFGDGPEESFLADAYGKRMPYLPSKILGTYTYEGETEADNYKFDYQFEGDYLKSVTIINYGEEEDDVYSVEQYVFYFED